MNSSIGSVSKNILLAGALVAVFMALLILGNVYGQIAQDTSDAVSPPLIASVNIGDWEPPSSDPSAITYLPPGAVAPDARLLIADARSGDDDDDDDDDDDNEGPNLFLADLEGNLLQTFDVTSYVRRLAGVAWNPANGRLLLLDGEDHRILEIGDPWDDPVLLRTIDTAPFGSRDPQDLARDPHSGHFLLLDGRSETIFRLVATGNGRWVPTGSFDLSDFGIGPPRGLTVDALSGNLLVLDRDGYIVELNSERELVREIDLSSAEARNTGGVVLLPGSDATRPLFVVGRRDDDDDDDDDDIADDDDDERGYLFSFALPVSDPPPTPTPPVVTTTLTSTSTPAVTGTPGATTTPGPTMTATPTGTPAPQPQNVVAYLPLMAMQRDHDELGEPNDDCTRAFPLLVNDTYAFMAEDANDWYHFSLTQSAQLTVHLTDFTPRHGQVAVFVGSTCADATFLMNNGDSSEQKTVFLGRQPAGHFYVYISNDGEATTDHYHLRIETE